MAYNTGAYVKVGTSFQRVNVPSHWNLIDGMPTNFPPTAHNHDASNINAGTLNADRIPTLAQNKITNLTTDLASKLAHADRLKVYTTTGGTGAETDLVMILCPTTASQNVFGTLYLERTSGHKNGTIVEIIYSSSVTAGDTSQNLRVLQNGHNEGVFSLVIRSISGTNYVCLRRTGVAYTLTTGWFVGYSTFSGLGSWYATPAGGSTLTLSGSAYVLGQKVLLDNDVYSWAKASTKPSYNQDEVGDGTTYKRVTQSEKDSWNAKSTLVLGETSVTAYRGDRGKIAYDHSQSSHAPTNAITGITKAMVETVLTGTITTHGHSYVPLPIMGGNAGKIMKINSSENGFDLATALTGGYTQIFLVAGNNTTAADGSEIIVSGYNDLVIVLSSASDGTTTTNNDFIYVNKSWCVGGTLPNFPQSDFYLDSAWLYIMWDYVSANGKYVSVWAR